MKRTPVSLHMPEYAKRRSTTLAELGNGMVITTHTHTQKKTLSKLKKKNKTITRIGRKNNGLCKKGNVPSIYYTILFYAQQSIILSLHSKNNVQFKC